MSSCIGVCSSHVVGVLSTGDVTDVMSDNVDAIVLNHYSYQVEYFGAF